MTDYRQVLAERARHRRYSLDLTIEEVARRAKVSPVTIGHIEAGRSVKDRTLWRLDIGLDWVRGSAEQILKTGGEADPTELPASGERLSDPDEIAIWNLDALSERRRREIIAELRVALRQLDDDNNGAGHERTQVS